MYSNLSKPRRIARLHQRQKQQQQQQQQRPAAAAAGAAAITFDSSHLDEQSSAPPPWANPEANVPHGFWQDVRNHRLFFDWAAKQFNIASYEDWYRISTKQVADLGGSGLLTSYYNSSLTMALMKVYPEYEWIPWRFAVGAPNFFWRDPQNHRRFFAWAAKQLNIERMEDWYRVTKQDIARLGGEGLLSNYYQSSISKALMAVYPEHNWMPMLTANRGSRTPHGFWSDFSRHKQFFDYVAQQLGVVRVPEDWYRVTYDHIDRLGGGLLLRKYYEFSLIKALQRVYPEVEWLPWLFDTGVPRNYWADLRNHRKFFDWAARQLGITHFEQWYKCSSADIVKLGGMGLLYNHYDNSLVRALATVYPEHEWVPWCFDIGVPRGFWSDPSNHRRFFDWVARRLGVAKPEDWYEVTVDDVTRLGGLGLMLAYYDCSMIRAMTSVYPEVEWQLWRFRRFAVGANPEFDRSHLRRYVEFVMQELRIKQLDEWYRVSLEQVRQVGGFSIVTQFGGSLHSMLATAFPEHNWDANRFNNIRGKKASQRSLRVAVQQLFPNEEIIEEYHHTSVVFENKRAITLDLWIPSLSLAFEFQGQQHYHDVYVFGSSAKQQERDVNKSKECVEEGITLVSVPYWWDRTVYSLAATICAVRPDLSTRPEVAAAMATPAAKPIPSEPPKHTQRDRSAKALLRNG